MTKRATTTCVIVTPGDVKNVTSVTDYRLLNVATQVFCNTWCTGACDVWEHAGFGIHVAVFEYIIRTVVCSVV